jgi:hypothetical protein
MSVAAVCEVGNGNDGTLRVCCSSHDAMMCEHHYARTHFVETSPAWNGPGCESPEIQVIVTRDVGPDQVEWLERVYKTGEGLWTFHGVTYGCVDERAGAALSEQRGEYPFFEFPYDAFKPVATASPDSTESKTGEA